jgi:4-amino-4-deoxychorismate lyase
MADWICNGKVVEKISINDRGLQYGDGLFETVAIRDGEPRLWAYHMERLSKGCELLGFTMPSKKALLEGVFEALATNGVPSTYAVAKIIISAGAGKRGYARSDVESPTVLIGAFESERPSADAYRDGVGIMVCKTRLATGSAFAGLKTLNRLEQVAAQSEVKEEDAYEGLTMDADGNLICGTMSNVFFIKDNCISTPPLDRCGVAGVMRRHIIETLHEKGIQIDFGHTKLSDLSSLDELFLSNSQFGVVPINKCGDITWQVGEHVRTVMAILANNGVDECRQ